MKLIKHSVLIKFSSMLVLWSWLLKVHTNSSDFGVFKMLPRSWRMCENVFLGVPKSKMSIFGGRFVFMNHDEICTEARENAEH